MSLKNKIVIKFIIGAYAVTAISGIVDSIIAIKANKRNATILKEYILANQEIGDSQIVKLSDGISTEDYLVVTERSRACDCVKVVPYRIVRDGKDGAFSVESHPAEYITSHTFCVP